MSATIAEYLQAAEYVLKGGNTQMILCERGVRTFEPSTRELDGAIPMLKRHTHLPVLVDPSHGTGHAWMVPHSRGRRGAGADGLLIEVTPPSALSDGAQSLTPDRSPRSHPKSPGGGRRRTRRAPRLLGATRYQPALAGRHDSPYRPLAARLAPSGLGPGTRSA